ncbi:hypothetical protein BANRA_01392 [Escherichia coli]|nr:hypothetical protein BANRA_01392 [Escherichia coli]
MDLENKFSYHFLEGLTLTEDGILLKEMSKFIFHRKS